MSNPTTTLSISTILADGDMKPYLGTTLSHGYEWGVGIGGSYSAHSHEAFGDVLFSPAGLEIRVGEHRIPRCTLFIAAPGTFFNPERLGDFWFMKFLMDPRVPRPTLPEKRSNPPTSTQPGMHYIAMSSGEARFAMAPWGGEYETTVRFIVTNSDSGPMLEASLAGHDTFLVSS